MENKKEIVTARVCIGAYGSAPGQVNDGVVERIIEPPEGGTFMKFIGCSYLYKGLTDQKVVDILYFPKRRLRNLISFLSTKWGMTLTILLFPFRKKVLIFLAEQYLKDIYLPALEKHLYLGEKKFSISVRELKRVIDIMINEQYGEKKI